MSLRIDVHELGLCLGWKGQCICCVTRGGGREGGEGRGGREVGRGGDGWREGGMGGGWGGGGGGREGGMNVIHILICMFNSNPMIPQ